MRLYVFIWIVVSAALAFEYWAMVHHPGMSQLLRLQQMGWIDRTVKMRTDPGGTLSLWLGWIGLGLMIIMNAYSIRKRSGLLQGKGTLKSWLNFHVFCGLLGPTLILFHCGLKVRGIVGISFWSMIVSFSSGVIGRYFYLQLSRQKSEYESQANDWMQKFRRVLEKNKVAADEQIVQTTIKKALVHSGVDLGHEAPNVFATFFLSFLGDMRLMVAEPGIPAGWPGSTRLCLQEYAVNLRRSRSLKPFQKLMGHWHSFHFPFAVFMYIAAAIHVASSLIFLRTS